MKGDKWTKEYKLNNYEKMFVETEKMKRMKEERRTKEK